MTVRDTHGQPTSCRSRHDRLIGKYPSGMYLSVAIPPSPWIHIKSMETSLISTPFPDSSWPHSTRAETCKLFHAQITRLSIKHRDVEGIHAAHSLSSHIGFSSTFGCKRLKLFNALWKSVSSIQRLPSYRSRDGQRQYRPGLAAIFALHAAIFASKHTQCRCTIHIALFHGTFLHQSARAALVSPVLDGLLCVVRSVNNIK